MKIKILTYCLGLLVAGFVIAAPGSNVIKGKTSSNHCIVKVSMVDKFISENTIPCQSSDNNNFVLFHSGIQSLFHSLDFQIEPVIARHENLYRTNRWFATHLKI